MKLSSGKIYRSCPISLDHDYLVWENTNVNNEAFLWKIAVLGMEKPPIGAGTFCPSPVLVLYIPPCRKCFPASGADLLPCRCRKIPKSPQNKNHRKNCRRFMLAPSGQSGGIPRQVASPAGDCWLPEIRGDESYQGKLTVFVMNKANKQNLSNYS
jgi:hypothetical protein